MTQLRLRPGDLVEVQGAGGDPSDAGRRGYVRPVAVYAGNARILWAEILRLPASRNDVRIGHELRLADSRSMTSSPWMASAVPALHTTVVKRRAWFSGAKHGSAKWKAPLPH